MTEKLNLSAIEQIRAQAKTTSYWLTIIITIAAAVVIFVIPEDNQSLVSLRIILAIVFVMFLPGFVFVKTLFQNDSSVQNSSTGSDSLERLALSVAMSLIITSIIGLILNSTPWGVTLSSVTLTLLAFTLIFATIAMFRDLRRGTTKNRDIT